MAVKKEKGDPEANPRFFLKLFRHQIPGRRRKIAARVLNLIIGSVHDPELKYVAKKASKHFLGKKADPAKRDKFRKKCLKRLREMRTRSRESGDQLPEKAED